MLKILIVDDHPLVRKGILRLLSDELDDALIGEAANGVEAMKAVRDEPWDLVLLDLCLPGRGGLELLREIKTARSRLPVLILSAYPEDQFLTRVLKLGAAGYLTKDSSSQTLLSAVRMSLAGGRFVSLKAAVLLALEQAPGEARALHEQLSDREFDVMLRIARGQTVSQIADVLYLGVKTVSTYRRRVLDKMGLKNNADLAHYALRSGLIE